MLACQFLAYLSKIFPCWDRYDTLFLFYLDFTPHRHNSLDRVIHRTAVMCFYPVSKGKQVRLCYDALLYNCYNIFGSANVKLRLI